MWNHTNHARAPGAMAVKSRSAAVGAVTEGTVGTGAECKGRGPTRLGKPSAASAPRRK